MLSIDKVTLSIEPSDQVAWGSSVTLRCQAELSHPETVDFTIYKGTNVVCTETKTSSTDLLCPLSNLTVDHSGSYKCVIRLDSKQKTSQKRLTVTGVYFVCSTCSKSIKSKSGVFARGVNVVARVTASKDTVEAGN